MRDDLRILILEDDDNDVELIRRCLKKEIPAIKIMRVRTRGAFESALDRRDYDLILSDSTLPGFSGNAALALARQRGVDCPFIFVSGTLGGRRAVKETPHEADARLSKDEIRTLPSVIEAVMERSSGKTSGVSGGESVGNAEERYCELLDSVHAIVWRGDARTFQFTYVSREAEVLLGHPPEHWLEPNFWQNHIHPDDREAAISFCKKATEEKRSHEFEYRMMAADGRVVWFRDVVRVIVEEGRPKELFGVMIDISERRQAEALLEGQKDLLEMIAMGTRLEQVLDGLTRFVEARSEGMLCSILLAEDNGRRLRRGAAPSLPEAYNRLVDGLPIAPGAGSCGTAAHRRERVIVTDTLSDPLWAEYRGIAREFGLRACWSAPVFATDGKVLGTFAMYYREPRSPTNADLELIERAAHIASIAIERQRSEEELRGANERLQGMSRRLVELQEAERRHVARELHDEIGQLLTALKMTLPAHSHPNRAGAAGDLKRARGLVDELTSRVRELSMDLRPAMLDDLGLLPALLWHFERYSTATGVRVNFRHSEIEGRRFEPEIETAAYRIVQEALTNVARHAGVKEAVVVVSNIHKRLHLEIEDRGRGFDARDARIGERSSGLAGMRERALLLGGDFAIESVVAGGTRLKATLPLFKSARLDQRSAVSRSQPGKVCGRADENSTEPRVA